MLEVTNRTNRKRCEICSFKVDNKDTRITSLKSFRYLYCYLWTYFTHFSTVSTVNFEQVNASKCLLGSWFWTCKDWQFKWVVVLSYHWFWICFYLWGYINHLNTRDYKYVKINYVVLTLFTITIIHHFHFFFNVSYKSQNQCIWK